jgi:NADH-quinone oxidoreductase subunit L
MTEWVFIIISLVVAGFGMALGWLFYVKNTSLPDIWATRLRPLYQASYNKYWVDEFFGWAVTRRTMDAARAVFAFDSKVIDGGVNGSAWLTKLSSRLTGATDQYFVDGLVNAIAAFVIRLMSPLFRAAQTGFAQNYALVMVLGLVAAVAMFFGADIARAFKAIFAIGF